MDVIKGVISYENAKNDELWHYFKIRQNLCFYNIYGFIVQKTLAFQTIHSFNISNILYSENVNKNVSIQEHLSSLRWIKGLLETSVKLKKSSKKNLRFVISDD